MILILLHQSIKTKPYHLFVNVHVIYTDHFIGSYFDQAVKEETTFITATKHVDIVYTAIAIVPHLTETVPMDA